MGPQLRRRQAVLRTRRAPARTPANTSNRSSSHGDRNNGNDEDQEQRQLRLGAWVGNQRSRAATLSPDRIEQLSAIGMRWT
ncbi:helicase associated domain-containing protein [Streptomyces luteogriseus]|uniref:helicase associated domain-containing protein n=1 Tax=Streptomyces luteogriseus TaxID=68233 RepID=UPI0028AACF6B|nr:helicase associated domain-containing protein [Streptomyces luteogriseus]